MFPCIPCFKIYLDKEDSPMNLDEKDYPSDGLIIVRPLRIDDTPAVFEAVRESLEALKPWMSWAHDDYRIEETRQFVSRATHGWENEDNFAMAIIDARDGAFLGGTGLNNLSQEYRLANLGYWVRSSRRGRGIAPRAARLAARFAFERLGLIRAEIVVAVGNTASLRAAEKSGATREGVLRNRVMVGEKIFDAVMFSLTPQDFGLEPNKG
jgi:ribosomal-protein-serine acetyltransferase